jgi:dihydrofolate reductase
VVGVDVSAKSARTRCRGNKHKEVSMRKIAAFLVATVDGYYEGPNQEFDWPVVDEEFNQFAVQQLDEADTLLFGRATYQGMAAYWPTPTAQQNDPEVTGRMNSFPKIVVSRTLEEADWANTRVIKDDVAEELTKLKQQPGKDVLLLGSSNLTVSLLRMGLVDELRIMVNPVVLGDGKSLFRTADDRINLKLLKTRPFSSGNVLLYYQPTTR